MNILSPREDFIILEDFFTPDNARFWLKLILGLGEDPLRGFHHPFVKPNRFHRAPKYPVKKYMGLGLYWNPLDYKYLKVMPGTEIRPHAIPLELRDLCWEVLAKYFPTPEFDPQGVIVNFYTQDSSMGLHVDKDEEDKTSPVIGLNFGSTCRFFYEDERGEMKDLRIRGNSLYIFGGKARQMRHGLGSIYAKTLSEGSEEFLQNKERLNLTVRQVFKKR
jgi:alkylated DNA repair dioxygenase AlkB